MSSPYSSTERSRSSPSLLRTHGQSRSNRNSYHEVHAVQLMEDRSRMLSADDRTFKRKLDEEALSQQRRHVEALERALQQHEAVRRSAEHTYEAYQIELERQRVAREAAQTRKLAEERRKLDEARLAETKRAEEARQREEESRKEQQRLEQERELAQKRREEEAQNQARQKVEQERAAAEAKARTEEAAREAQRREQEQQQQQQQQQQEARQQTAQSASVQQPGVSQASGGQVAAPNVPPGLVTTLAEREQLHKTYLALHAQCKVLRREIMQIKDSNRQMYDTIRDNARHVKLAVGQLAKNDSAGNRKRIQTIQEYWNWSIGCCPSETADINLYRIQPVEPMQIPKVFLYMVNYTVKIVVKQLAYEATVDPERAEPIGILTATLFSKPEFKPGGHFMSDMFLAKFHRSHATMFGLRFNELTPEGRDALGFKPDLYSNKTMWHDAVRAMSRGYAAVTLRDFSRSPNENPFPNRLYWEALSRILTTPVEHRMALHYVTVEGLLDPLFVPRFVKFYGNNAIAAMRLGVLEFPKPPHKQGHEMQKTALANMNVKFQEMLNLHRSTLHQPREQQKQLPSQRHLQAPAFAAFGAATSAQLPQHGFQQNSFQTHGFQQRTFEPHGFGQQPARAPASASRGAALVIQPHEPQQNNFEPHSLQQHGSPQQPVRASATASRDAALNVPRCSFNEKEPPRASKPLPVFERVRVPSLGSSMWATDEKEDGKRFGISSQVSPAGLTTRSSTSVQWRPLSGEAAKGTAARFKTSLPNNWYN